MRPGDEGHGDEDARRYPPVEEIPERQIPPAGAMRSAEVSPAEPAIDPRKRSRIGVAIASNFISPRGVAPVTASTGTRINGRPRLAGARCQNPPSRTGQVVIATGNAACRKALPTRAGLKTFWPSPPKTSLPKPMATAPPRNAIHKGRPGGKVRPRSRPVMAPDPSRSDRFGAENPLGEHGAESRGRRHHQERADAEEVAGDTTRSAEGTHHVPHDRRGGGRSLQVGRRGNDQPLGFATHDMAFAFECRSVVRVDLEQLRQRDVGGTNVGATTAEHAVPDVMLTPTPRSDPQAPAGREAAGSGKPDRHRGNDRSGCRRRTHARRVSSSDKTTTPVVPFRIGTSRFAWGAPIIGPPKTISWASSVIAAAGFDEIPDLRSHRNVQIRRDASLRGR